MLKLAAVIILLLGISNRFFNFYKSKGTVNGINSPQETTQTPTLSPIPTNALPLTLSPDKDPALALTVTLSPPPSNQFIYPGSTLASSGTYTTPDSYLSVVDWYKSQIEKNKFNIKTTVNTTSNGNSKAVIQASGASGRIDVTITRSATDPFTTITNN